MCSAGDNAALPALGFPIRESTGQRLFSASPWLIAAVHALLRLLVPRHPPPALTILTVITPAGSADAVIPVHLAPLCSFQGPRRGVRLRTERGRPGDARGRPRRQAPVSQNSTACEP